MKEPQYFKFSPIILAIPLYFVLFLWIVFWFEMKFGYNFNTYGIFPRTIKGLRGLVFSPFIHSDIKHLYHNSIPLFVLLFTLFYFYRNMATKVIVYGVLLSGLLTWSFARKSYHIGASSIIYLLFGFLFFSGVFRKNIRLIAVALAVIFIYGSIIWYILPIKEGVSWEGHLSGLLVGSVIAFIYRKKGLQKFKYHWEQEEYMPDDFDLMFDEDGNFNPPKVEDSTEE